MASIDNLRYFLIKQLVLDWLIAFLEWILVVVVRVNLVDLLENAVLLCYLFHA